MRAIGASHTACKDEFRRNLRSHSWSVFSFFIIMRTYYLVMYTYQVSILYICILLSKLYHIIAHPPLGARGDGERGRPPGLLLQQPHAIVRNPESASIPTGNVELSTPASNNSIWLSLRTHCVPPLPPFALP